MAHPLLKERAQQMRHAGESIAHIAKSLGANKSTVSYWCRDISLSEAQQQALARRQKDGAALGRVRASEMKRAKRFAAIHAAMQRGGQDVGNISRRDLFMLGLGLYWGEGYKRGNDECGITNSDPAIILIFIRWMHDVYGVEKSDLTLRISVNETHRDRIRLIEKYWSDVTRIPQSQFTMPSFIRAESKKKYLNAEQHFGTLRVKIRRGTALRRRILGSLEALKQTIR